MKTLMNLRNQLIIVNDQLITAKQLLKSMESDPTKHFADEIKESYDQMLDECYYEEFENFPFELGLPSVWMEENEPVTYRCGMSDHEFDYSNLSEYIEQQELVDQLESEAEDLETEIEELQTEIEELEESENN